VLLDLMLPFMNGLDVLRKLRENRKTAQTPIIVVSAKGEESDVVVGLELGADDYVAKPFNMSVLLARINAVATLPTNGSGLANRQHRTD